MIWALLIISCLISHALQNVSSVWTVMIDHGAYTLRAQRAITYGDNISVVNCYADAAFACYSSESVPCIEFLWSAVIPLCNKFIERNGLQ